MIDDADDAAQVLGTPCVGCGVILTRDNLSALTRQGAQLGPVGLCTTCRPKALPAGMANPANGTGG